MTRYSEFRQATRRHAPSELIPAVAAAAALQVYEKDVAKWAKGVPPWAYAAMARDCLLYSDEHRYKKVDDQAIIWMRNILNDVYEPDERLVADIFAMISGYVYEQSFYQKDEMQEMARSYLLYTQTEVPEQYRIPSGPDWEEHLGLPLRLAITASFMLCAWAASNHGRVDPKFPNSAAYEPLEGLVSGADMNRVLDLLTTTVPVAKARAKEVRQLPNSLQRYAFNPLVERPFVAFDDGVRYAPQPKFVLRAFSTENLYYRGVKRWGNAFGQAFGARLEAYTGMQLQHTGKHQVLPEFEWRKNRTGKMRSSDWFLITPAATILIECKSARMSLDAKAGTGAADELLDRYVSHAYDQLGKNAAQIREGNPAFAHVPSDRPLLGLVVTAEPMFGANHVELRERFGTNELPVLTASLEDIELIASLDPRPWVMR
ncbi:hypothetical protein AHiyo8_00610 [Arthrobacter sp. Hiyo8]|nr:hypothetical protein AHiyo8_00610 [Arthrobacter sp. Hiyo8]